MRKETIELTYYTFDELTDGAKEKARDWYRERDLSDDWWEFTYDDAERIGLKILSFDERSCEAKFISSAEETAHKIETEHGESCETFQDAKNYLKERDEIVNAAPKDENGDLESEWELDQKLDDLDEEFLYTLQEDYRVMLMKEVEYLQSNEAVDDNIRANEYEFTVDGKVA